ncbi:HAMP domain-containing sensor histidine kinase [Rhodoferax mekongensis]|uniref:histidine kinase n=1 Tax=Rhodoferax mekongensis TaxID=3068341 RepID=A0ABZ0AZT3_9BURK|nr:ATP-binding protein [Rhodoferax sp. TBRC 17307]WNO05175.1 ATP-binding protein [Rhodoferax sp. TBRC 17307]
MFLHRLYVRIWLAVILAVIVLTLLAGWAWRMTSEPPLREVVVRNEYGEVIGNGRARLSRPPPMPGLGMGDGPADNKDDNADGPDENRPGRFGRGPEFLVRMQDGQTIHLHLPRPPNSSFRAPFGFGWTLALVALAVALGTYPIIRRLTRRLESLQHGVERWGSGDLSARVAMQGDDEVGFLASRFNHAAEQIETLVRSRDTLLASQKSLLANASHELRSPLARIRMGLELMGSSPSPAFKQEISRNISELDQLIEEILLASRLDAKEADLGTIEQVELIGLAAEECARNQAQLDVEAAELAVPGVAKLLRRAVHNLLENARRYGAGEVRLVLRQDGDWAVLQVCDAGPGVPPEQQERIFEPFYRLPGASEREGGVGLGLALVKSIAERHGGNVKCSNRPEGGACFEIRLPMRKG